MLSLQPCKNSFCISSSLKYSNPLHHSQHTHEERYSIFQDSFPVSCLNGTFPEPLPACGVCHSCVHAPATLYRLFHKTPQTLKSMLLFTCLFSFNVCILRAEIKFKLWFFCSHLNFSFSHSTLHILSSRCIWLNRIKAVWERALPHAWMVINVSLAR